MHSLAAIRRINAEAKRQSTAKVPERVVTKLVEYKAKSGVRVQIAEPVKTAK